jgi:tetratricopeptide (TPR) repeat protein
MIKLQQKIKDGRATRPAILAFFGLFAVALVVSFVWTTEWPSMERQQPVIKPAGKAQPGSDSSGIQAMDDGSDSPETVRFLLDRVKREPDDFLVQNMVASAMLLRVRETGNADYLERAKSAAAMSLATVPPERNPGGLSARARAEMAEHDFVKAREDGLHLTKIHPEELNSWGVLTDALLELGDYAKADAAIHEMRKLASDTAETEIRVGRLLFLDGDTEEAQKHLFRALAFTRNIPAPPRETMGWCLWQLGEIAFSTGDYTTAERYYREALDTYPGYPQALASLGRVRAAHKDLPAAIRAYEEAVRRFPDPTFVAALGDLYHLAGREREAQIQYGLVEQIGHLNALNGTRYNRQLAVFYSDHNLKPQEAYEDAVREYQERRDIYGADTLAWTALKAGKLREAQQAMDEALRLSTRDARLLYHAGMIASANGNRQLSRDYLKQSLALCPNFDPLQALIAGKALAE